MPTQATDLASNDDKNPLFHLKFKRLTYINDYIVVDKMLGTTIV